MTNRGNGIKDFAATAVRGTLGVFLVIAAIAAGTTLYHYFQTATVQLVNTSDGYASFLVDGKPACQAAPNTECTVRIRTVYQHTLSATDVYGDGTYPTPTVQLFAKAGEIYRFEACGKLGTPNLNCGLFSVSTVPPTY